MNINFPPNTDPNLYSLIAIAIAYTLANDLTATELNSVGNWLELVGQYLLTVGAQQQLIENRLNTNNNQTNINYKIDYLIKAIKKIEEELDKIKKTNN